MCACMHELSVLVVVYKGVIHVKHVVDGVQDIHCASIIGTVVEATALYTQC